MTAFRLPESTGILTSILDDFQTQSCSPSETVERIDLLLKNYPEILSNAAAEGKLCEMTAILLSQQSKMDETAQEAIKQLFFKCHNLSPKRVNGLLLKGYPVKDEFSAEFEGSACIRGRQNYPVPIAILKRESLPINAYFRSLEIKLNDYCTRRISAGLLGHFSEMVGRMVKAVGFAPPTSLKLEMLDSNQFDILIAYLETGNSALINQKNAVELLYAADFLQIPSLITDCKKYLVKQRDPTSILYLINFLKFHKSEVLVMVLEQQISDYLISELSKDELSEDFLFKLEQFKKEISTPLSISLARSKIKNDQLHLLENIPIASLDLSRCENLTKGCLEPLQRFDQLRTLKIRTNSWVTDDVFPLIPDQVRTLSVEGCKEFSGIGIGRLSSTQVRELYLFGCFQLTDEDLSKLPLQLEVLDLRHQNQMGQNAFERLSEMEKLHTLVLAEIPIAKDQLACLPRNLRNLDITLCFSEEGFLPRLSQLAHLEKLYASNNPVHDEDIRDIPQTVNTLALVNCIQITDAGVSKLGERVEIKRLFLRRCPKITEDSIEKLPDGIEVDWDAPSATRLALRK